MKETRQFASLHLDLRMLNQLSFWVLFLERWELQPITQFLFSLETQWPIRGVYISQRWKRAIQRCLG